MENLIEITFQYTGNPRRWTITVGENDSRYSEIMNRSDVVVLDVKIIGRRDKSGIYHRISDDTNDLKMDDYKAMLDYALDIWDLDWARDLARRMRATTYRSGGDIDD